MIGIMKILLNAINAKYIHSNLAVYSLRAYAKEYREHIRLLEYTINNRVEEILEGIYKEHADVICFSCYIWNIAYVKELIEELKKLCPNTPIWVGGPEVSYEVETLLAENPGIDGVFIGEGRRTFAGSGDRIPETGQNGGIYRNGRAGGYEHDPILL